MGGDLVDVTWTVLTSCDPAPGDYQSDTFDLVLVGLVLCHDKDHISTYITVHDS